MDIFNEQIIKQNSGFSGGMAKVLLWIVAIMLDIAVIGAGVFTLVAQIDSSFLAYCAVIAIFITGACIVLCRKFNVEFEYAITNGEVDIDKIVAQRKRTKVLNFQCSEIERVSKNDISNGFKKIDCVDDGKNTRYIIVRSPREGRICLVFSPNEKLRADFKKFFNHSLDVSDWD